MDSRNSNEDTVEIAVFGVNYSYDNYEDCFPILRGMAESRLNLTSTQLDALKKHRIEVAREFGFEDLAIVETISESMKESIVEKINGIVKTAEEKRIKEEAKRKKAKLDAERTAKARAAAKAKRAIEKARKTLKELGEIE